MKTQSDYTVLSTHSFIALMADVNALLKLGYVLVGGVCVVYKPREESPFMYTQTLVKEKE